MKARLYTTLGCHLCEEAAAMLGRLAAAGLAVEVEAVDIADSEQLLADYGMRIPVVAGARGELAWPFSLDELRAFLEAA